MATKQPPPTPQAQQRKPKQPQQQNQQQAIQQQNLDPNYERCTRGENDTLIKYEQPVMLSKSIDNENQKVSQD